MLELLHQGGLLLPTSKPTACAGALGTRPCAEWRASQCSRSLNYLVCFNVLF